MPMTPARMEEIVSILNGSRVRGAGARAAVLVQDLLSVLEQLPTGLKSAQITAAPTMAQFNDLQADLAAIHRSLQSLASAMKDRSAR